MLCESLDLLPNKWFFLAGQQIKLCCIIYTFSGKNKSSYLRAGLAQIIDFGSAFHLPRPKSVIWLSGFSARRTCAFCFWLPFDFVYNWLCFVLAREWE